MADATRQNQLRRVNLLESMTRLSCLDHVARGTEMAAEGARRLNRALKQSRKDPVGALSAIALLHRDQRSTAAQSRAIRQIAQRNADQLLSHAKSLAAQGQWQAVAEFLTPVLTSGLPNPDLIRLGAEAFLICDLPHKTVRLLRRDGVPVLQDGHALALLGQALSASGRSDDARPLLAQAMVKGYPFAGLALGQLHLQRGRITAACAAWRDTVQRAPEAGDAWMHLAQFGDLAQDPDARAQLDAAAALPMPAAARTCLEFARGNVALDQGDGEAGFTHLDMANACHRALSRYDRARDAAIFAAIQARCATLPQPDAQPAQTLFITGLPRSGSSLVARALARHPQVHDAGELAALYKSIAPEFDDLSPTALNRIAASYREMVQPLRQDAPLLIDKMPLNLRWIGPALAAMPEARVIYLRRPRAAVALSLYRHHLSGAANRFAYDWADILHYLTLCDALISFWQERWGPDRLRVVEFHDFVTSPETQIPALLGFCGLPDDRNCLSPHLGSSETKTASARQVLSPISADLANGWMRWADEVETRLDVVAKML